MPRPSPERRSVSFIRQTTQYNPWFAQSSSSGSYDALYREYGSINTPGYWGSKRARRLPNHSYTMYTRKVQASSVTLSSSHVNPSYLLTVTTTSTVDYCPINPFATQPGTLVTEAKNRALLRMQKQASSIQVNLATFFGERRQTADMIADTATRIARGASALRRADLKTFIQSLSLSGGEAKSIASKWKHVERTPVKKRISSFWLEYVYGWRPLLNDITDAAEMLAKQVVEPSRSYHGKIRASARRTQSFADNSPRGGLSHICVDNFWSHSVGVRCEAYYTLENEARSVLAQTGITNPLLLGWELLPYSFVVDWFVPVGTYLESLTAFDGFVLSDGFVTTLERSAVSSSLSYYADGTDPWSTSFASGGGHLASAVRMVRSAPYSLNYVPVVKSPIGGRPLERFATAMSLLTQIFGR